MDKRIAKIVKHASENIPYYIKMLEGHFVDCDETYSYEEFCEIPLLQKSIIQSNPDYFIDKTIQKSDLQIERTSGSTGRPLIIYWSNTNKLTSLYHLWRARKDYHGINIQDRMCQFHPFIARGDVLETPKTIKLDRNTLSFSWLDLNDDYFKEFYNLLVEHNPVWISSAPSPLYLFSKYIKRNNLKIPLRLNYIECAGEYLSQAYIKVFKEIFPNVKIVNQYGCREVNAIALECSAGNLHVLEGNVFVEILKDGDPVLDGEQGEIYITGLANFSMPLIRYRLGDSGSLSVQHKCSCGNRSPILHVNAGRVSELIYFKEREPLSSIVFWYAIQKINIKHNNVIQQFNILQVDFDIFEVTLVTESINLELMNCIANQFLGELKVSRFPQKCKWKFDFVSEINVESKSGKLKYYSSNLTETIKGESER